MKHSSLSPETQQLLDRKNELFSAFSDSEDRIDRKISSLAQRESVEISNIPSDLPEEHTGDPLDQLFDEAVEKAARRQHDEPIAGFHTEEILGVEEALAALNTKDHHDSPDLCQVESLLNQAEDLLGTMPDNRYIAARAAVDKMVQDNNPLQKKRPATVRSKNDSAIPNSHSVKARQDATSKVRKDAVSETPQVSTSKVPKNTSAKRREATAPETHQVASSKVRENTAPERHRDTAPERCEDAVLTPSAKTEFLTLMIALLTLSLFIAVLAPVICRIDYLALLTLVIFMPLTLDLSFKASLTAAAIMPLAYLAGYIREISIGVMALDLVHPGWLLLLPLCMISAARFIQKVYPKTEAPHNTDDPEDREILSSDDEQHPLKSKAPEDQSSPSYDALFDTDEDFEDEEDLFFNEHFDGEDFEDDDALTQKNHRRI